MYIPIKIIYYTLISYLILVLLFLEPLLATEYTINDLLDTNIGSLDQTEKENSLAHFFSLIILKPVA